MAAEIEIPVCGTILAKKMQGSSFMFGESTYLHLFHNGNLYLESIEFSDIQYAPLSMDV